MDTKSPEFCNMSSTGGRSSPLCIVYVAEEGVVYLRPNFFYVYRGVSAVRVTFLLYLEVHDSLKV